MSSQIFGQDCEGILFGDEARRLAPAGGVGDVRRGFGDAVGDHRHSWEPREMDTHTYVCVYITCMCNMYIHMYILRFTT